ncbi:DUF4296 domain-containing protein [Pedobacter sp. Leaf194]|uniref:DUF4296 domain-containing protein n=1 Tax=Pedobacter sp. Leaf194 TaxID=1736297 RepID=UPI000703295D|nr:DUF4296 domain-containing protein [Pedobacter sp. Leaf194]KQS34451.1 hypothetical protein ASG14_15115 [Pedobacter sp. Leaf194]RYD80258.1 MAG: DUF4296 domain-containing protein [Sphingobacteriales bacterium]
MRRLIWVLAVVFGIASCKEERPSNVIAPDKMQNILYDIHVSDGYISTIAMPDSSKKVAASYYKGIYKKFGIDSTQYAQSMSYYYKHPQDLDKMYKYISKRLSKQQKAMEKADSLAKSKIKVLPAVK